MDNLELPVALGVESDSYRFLEIFCPEHSLSEVSERRKSRIVGHLLPNMVMFGTCESFRRVLQNRNLKLAIHSLSSITLIGIKKGVLVENIMLNGPLGHLSSTNV